MKAVNHKDIQPEQDHWKTYKQIQTQEKTMQDITKMPTGYHTLEPLYQRFQHCLEKYKLEPALQATYDVRGYQ